MRTSPLAATTVAALTALAATTALLSGCTSTAQEPDAPTPQWREIDASAVDQPATWVDVVDSTSTHGDVGVLHVGRVRAGDGPAVAAVWEGPRVDVDTAAVVRDVSVASTLVDVAFVDDVPHVLGRERTDGGWRHFVLARRGPGDWADVGVTGPVDAAGVLATHLGVLPGGGLVAVGVDADDVTVAVDLAGDRVTALPVTSPDATVVELVGTARGVVAFLNAPVDASADPGASAEAVRAWSTSSPNGATWSAPLAVGTPHTRVEGAVSPDGRTLVVTADVAAPRRPGDAVFASRDQGLSWVEEVFVREKKGQPSVLSRPAVGVHGDVLVARTGLTQGHSATWRRPKKGVWRAGALVPGWWYYGTVPLLSEEARGKDDGNVVAYRQVGGTSEVRRGAKVVASTGVDDVWDTDARIARWAGVTRLVARDQIGLSRGARLRGRLLDVIPGSLTPGDWNRVDFERTPPHVVASAGTGTTAVALSNELSGDGWESLVRASTGDGSQWRVVPVAGNSRMVLLHDVAAGHDDTWWLSGTDLDGRPRLWRADADLRRFDAVTLPSPSRNGAGSLTASCSTPAGEWFAHTAGGVDTAGDAAATSTVLLRSNVSWLDVAALPVGTRVSACAAVADRVVVLGDSADTGSTLLSTTDGAVWEPATLPAGVHTVHAVAGGAASGVAHGVSGHGASARPVVLTSDDGRTWTELTTPTRDVGAVEDVAVIDGDIHVLARTDVGRRLWVLE